MLEDWDLDLVVVTFERANVVDCLSAPRITLFGYRINVCRSSWEYLDLSIGLTGDLPHLRIILHLITLKTLQRT